MLLNSSYHIQATRCLTHNLQSTSCAWLSLYEHSSRNQSWPQSLSMCCLVLQIGLPFLPTPQMCVLRCWNLVSASQFELAKKQGTALITKYPTYRDDVELESIFKAYTKHHYDSWAIFTHNTGHSNDIKPVLHHPDTERVAMAIGICHQLQCCLPDCNQIAIQGPNNNKQHMLKTSTLTFVAPCPTLILSSQDLIYI